MKFADLVQARLSLPEPVSPYCHVDDCGKPVSCVVTASFPDIAPRRVCLCSTCQKRIEVEQNPSSKPVGEWPAPHPTFPSAKKEK